MGESGIPLPVPVLDTGQDDDDRTWSQRDSRTALLLIATGSGSTDERTWPLPVAAWWICQLLRYPGSNVI